MGIAKPGVGNTRILPARKSASRRLIWSLALLFALAFCWAVGPGAAQDAPPAQAASGDAGAAARFSVRAETVLGAAPLDKGYWGILIEDAETSTVLYQKNADQYFEPASNMKVLTTALALDTLGPGYKFLTTLETNGSLSPAGVLTGDLILVGRGDPNLSNRKFPFEAHEEFEGPPEKVLAELADALVSRGVKQITGDVVGDDSYFPRERYPNGWEIDDMVWDYGAPISAIVVNDNSFTITLTPGEHAGDPVTAAVEPLIPEVVVVNKVATIAAKEKADLRLTREAGSDTIVISGVMPAHSTPRKLPLAVQEPALQAAVLLRRALAERGIKVRGLARAVHEPVAGALPTTVLAEHTSVALGDSVKLVNKISQNLHTEVLLRTAARTQGRWETPEDLAKFPAAFYAKAGVPDGDVLQTDGSGLSRHDLVTPRAFVAVLGYARKQAWFPVYFASLPVAGEDGTLNGQMKEPPLAGKIQAKTGSVTHVRSLSGYAETPGGRKLIFSILSNNEGVRGHDVQVAIDGLCRAMVEEFDRNAPAAAPN